MDIAAAVDPERSTGGMFARGMAIAELVELLLARGATDDLSEAGAAIDRLAAVPTDDGFVLHELPLLRLRALLTRAYGNDAEYRDYASNYRDLAHSLGFDGHIAQAESML